MPNQVTRWTHTDGTDLSYEELAEVMRDVVTSLEEANQALAEALALLPIMDVVDVPEGKE